ncbi:hypothetical protein VTL71DRAFT_8403, partial [Oculimacula yallundae]
MRRGITGMLDCAAFGLRFSSEDAAMDSFTRRGSGTFQKTIRSTQDQDEDTLSSLMLVTLLKSTQAIEVIQGLFKPRSLRGDQ